MRRLTAILLFAILSVAAAAQELPPCACPDSSALRFPGARDSFDAFASRLRSCRERPDSIVTIWHVGGSHVQAGWFSSRMRHNFDSLGMYPHAGRGYIFPYPLAHTNYDRSYSIGAEGEWTGSRSSNPNRKMPVTPAYGIMGIAACTTDTTAAFGLRMAVPFNRLHIICEAPTAPVVISGADTLSCVADTLLHGYVVDFHEETDSVRVEPRLHDGEFFTLTGLLPEVDSGGLRYISTGVNGARTTTWTERCPEFVRELGPVHPDLVIWGLGINDAACPGKDFNPERLKRNYRRLIDMVLAENPECAFVFITNNDSWRWRGRRMVHNDNGPAVRQAMYELAAEYGGAVWDLFGIMGGDGSATVWRDAGLMKNDRLHFTKEGYLLLGDMLYTALEAEFE